MQINGSDESYDGHLKIRKGEGLSQAIASELGLDEAACKKLGSVWSEILKIAENEKNLEEGSAKYEGKVGGKWQTFHVGEVFNFTKAAWNQIVDLVNGKLQTTIKKLDETGNENLTAKQDVIEVEELPLSQKYAPREIYHSDRNSTTSVVTDYDINGKPIRKYGENGTNNAYTTTIYDANGNECRRIQYSDSNHQNIKYITEMDANGKTIQTATYESGKWKYTYTEGQTQKFFYDDKGNLAYVEELSGDDNTTKTEFKTKNYGYATGAALFKAVFGLGSGNASSILNGYITEDNVVSIILDFNSKGVDAYNQRITEYLYNEFGLAKATTCQPAKILLVKAQLLGMENLKEYKTLVNALDKYSNDTSSNAYKSATALDNAIEGLIAKIKEAEAASTQTIEVEES